MKRKNILPALASAFVLLSCSAGKDGSGASATLEYARYLDFAQSTEDSVAVVTISPYTGTRDTLSLPRRLDNIVCMSSSHAGFLAAIHRDSVISAVSGIGYISAAPLRTRAEATLSGTWPSGAAVGTSRAEATLHSKAAGSMQERSGANPELRPLYDIGYDAAPDYERIIALAPQLLVAYSVSPSVPQYVSRLRSLGIKVLLLHEHLENHPLARAEYVKLFGSLTAGEAQADSLFSLVRNNYNSLKTSSASPCKVLLNIPYGEQWFIPGEDNYMSILIKDAGGEVLGAEKGVSTSRIIPFEQACMLARDADFWLNTGWCTSREELYGCNRLFRTLGIDHVYNNNRRRTPGGGNDFWESGAVRPDLILSDLLKIFNGEEGALEYYIEIK